MDSPRGEDKGEGEINKLPIAVCRLLIADWKNKELDSCWSLHLIYSCAGMTN